MSILIWILLGLVAGWLAELVVGGGFGLLGTILLGIVGALLGGFLSEALLGGPGVSGFNLTSIIVAFLGACLVLLIAHAVRGRRVY